MGGAGGRAFSSAPEAKMKILRKKKSIKKISTALPHDPLKTFMVKIPVFGSVKTFSRQALYVFSKNKRVTEIYFQNSEFVLGPVINVLL